MIKHVWKLVTTTFLSTTPLLAAVACSHNSATTKQIIDPQKPGDKKELKHNKVMFHIESLAGGQALVGANKKVPEITFSPSSFAIPNNVSAAQFLEAFHDWGTKNGHHGWWYETKKNQNPTILTFTIGSLTIKATYNHNSFTKYGTIDKPYHSDHFQLFDAKETKYTDSTVLAKVLDTKKPDPGGGGKTVIIPRKSGKISYAASAYYTTADQLKGQALFNQLHTIVTSKTTIGSYGDLYKTYNSGAFIDQLYENDGTILDIYSERPTQKDPYNFRNNRCGNYKAEGSCYNREHLIPQSKFDKRAPMHNDANFVWPSDGKVNGMRSNYPHGVVKTETWKSLNGSKLGRGQDGQFVFEPIDEFKGDVARAYFYFQLAYHGKASNFAPFTTGWPYFSSPYLSTYLKWAHNDPVDAFDIQRNNSIFKTQHNRNPFCDYPELVDLIFNNSSSSFHNLGLPTAIEHH